MKLYDFIEKYDRSRGFFDDELIKMEKNKNLYDGTYTQNGKQPTVKWNICRELLESQIDNTIPAPKVSHKIPTPDRLANIEQITALLNYQQKRIPFKVLNDEDERAVKYNGASLFFVQWDNSIKNSNSYGDIDLMLLSANQFIPQDGVYDIDKMDYFFLVFNDTKKRIEEKYNVSVEMESVDTKIDETINDEIATQIVCYYKNNGKIGCFSWCGITVLIDDENIQARKEKICSYCGKVKQGKECVCGSTEFEKRDKEYEFLKQDIETLTEVIPVSSPVMDNGEYVTEIRTDPMLGKMMTPTGQYEEVAKMEQTKIPYFYPNCYPIVLRKNVSIDNSVIGASDVEVVESQQYAINKLLTKASEKVLKGGSKISKGANTELKFSDEVLQPFNVNDPAELALLKVFDLGVDASPDINLAKELYYIAKSQLGVTDTFQGKQDNTATSGVAKEAQIQQAQGRLRSKQVMKNEAYRQMYKLIFLYTLAYCDEPIALPSQNNDGQSEEVFFNKYDFLAKDEYGNYYWDTDYIFDVDESGFNTNDTNAIMQYIGQDFASGMYGNPQDPETLLRTWQKKEEIGYPFANKEVEFWRNKVDEMKQQMEQQAQMQQMAQQMPQQIGGLNG